MFSQKMTMKKTTQKAPKYMYRLLFLYPTILLSQPSYKSNGKMNQQGILILAPIPRHKYQFALVAWWCFKIIRVIVHGLAFFPYKLTNHSSCFTRRLRIRLGQLIIISLISKAIEDLVCKAPNHSLHQVEWLGASYDSQSESWSFSLVTSSFISFFLNDCCLRVT